MIAKVAPIRRMPQKLSELDYLLPTEMIDKIKVGHLVFIPFRNLLVYGIVTALINDTTASIKNKIKSIGELVWEEPAFTQPQLNFLKEISEFYSTPLGFVLQSALLPLKKTKIKKINFEVKKEITIPERKKPELKIYKNNSEKKEIINKGISSIGQTLIIVPEVSAISEIINCLNTKENTTIISSDLGDKELFDLWVKIRSGLAQVVVGTRRALFMPWADLRSVIVDDEANPNHKSWDMAPRLHAREAALMLAHAHGAQCILTGHTPSVESQYFARVGVYSGTNEPSALHSNSTVLIDMRDQRRGRNYSSISTDLEEAMTTTSGDVFLFINRKGSSSYVGCRDCGFVSKCPTCQRGLVYHENTSTLECHFCHTKVKIFLTCPKCHGTNVAMYGVGTQLLENELKKKNFSDKTILRLDSDTIDIRNEKIEGKKIIIGTQLAWDKIDWSKITLMAFLDADSSLFIPEYKISENLWWQIRDAQFRLPDTAELIIQTGHTEHQIFSNLVQVEEYYKTELQERRLFSYPPFGYILRLYNGEKTALLSERVAQDLVTHLQALTKDQKTITISSPLPFSPTYFKGLYYYGIIVKIGFEKYKQSTKFIGHNIPEKWKFDPNPSNLLSF
ncbi:MAG: primosomal protein N' [uncultured bacterium]|nr:MAG: primosomal protein N' [uncultured bacterium]